MYDVIGTVSTLIGHNLGTAIFVVFHGALITAIVSSPLEDVVTSIELVLQFTPVLVKVVEPVVMEAVGNIVMESAGSVLKWWYSPMWASIAAIFVAKACFVNPIGWTPMFVGGTVFLTVNLLTSSAPATIVPAVITTGVVPLLSVLSPLLSPTTPLQSALSSPAVVEAVGNIFIF